MRQAYERRFRNFEQLDASGDTLLFVRVVATTLELGRAYELTQALSKRFGQQAALLPPGLVAFGSSALKSGPSRLICDFQKQVGPLMVDQFEDLMVYFLEPEAHQVKAPYRKAILTALEWLSGKELRMDVVPDFKALQALAAPSSWGLMGYGALHFRAVSHAFQVDSWPGRGSRRWRRP